MPLRTRRRASGFYEEINVTDRAANVLHLAVLEARIQHRKIVDVEDLILAILHDQTDTGAKMTLQAHHLDYIEANALLRQLANDVQGGLDLSDDDDDDMLFNDDDEEDRRGGAQPGWWRAADAHQGDQECDAGPRQLRHGPHGGSPGGET